LKADSDLHSFRNSRHHLALTPSILHYLKNDISLILPTTYSRSFKCSLHYHLKSPSPNLVMGLSYLQSISPQRLAFDPSTTLLSMEDSTMDVDMDIDLAPIDNSQDLQQVANPVKKIQTPFMSQV
jgi:hypothetical protein